MGDAGWVINAVAGSNIGERKGGNFVNLEPDGGEINAV